MFKSMLRSAAITGLLAVVLCGAAVAYDPNPQTGTNDVFYPFWNRGSTAAATYFWDNWGLMEGDTNPYDVATDGSLPVTGNLGTGTATVTVADPGAGLIGATPLAGFGTATNFWDMGPGGTMNLALDTSAGTKGMDIWVQVRYYLADGIAVAPTVNVVGATQSSPALITNGWYYRDFVQETGMMDGNMTGWMVYQSLWRLDPGKTFAGIDITADGTYGSIIDQVVVDTQILPEPGAIILAILGISALLLLRKIRRPHALVS